MDYCMQWVGLGRRERKNWGFATEVHELIIFIMKKCTKEQTEIQWKVMFGIGGGGLS